MLRQLRDGCRLDRHVAAVYDLSFYNLETEAGVLAHNQHIFRCDFKTKNFDAAFLRLAINGRLDEMIAKAHGGAGLQRITKGKLEAMLIALPPLAEPHRIVAKVDELMALCDHLEAVRAEREHSRDRFTLSTLARLNEFDPATFANDARFALANLHATLNRRWTTTSSS